MRTKHTRRQTQADLVDTAINMDRRQLPDFLNVKVGWHIILDDKQGNQKFLSLPPMSVDCMYETVFDKYPNCRIVDIRDLN